ncbi:hypothetical protein NC99_12780 [Sunxiuqinia dokdonensis]|uniref:Uncharacterized protein n=1 Tax=Sunxiuqinia dokdonensis TaxID=1409788 RepID=A0A0L8VCH8_9BACT|nr:hypothetical protein NC99_12780 [Sunxiuqinia dokdonensis]
MLFDLRNFNAKKIAVVKRAFVCFCLSFMRNARLRLWNIGITDVKLFSFTNDAKLGYH